MQTYSLLTIEAFPKQETSPIALTISLLKIIKSILRDIFLLLLFIDFYDLRYLHKSSILMSLLCTDIKNLHGQMMIKITEPQLSPYILFSQHRVHIKFCTHITKFISKFRVRIDFIFMGFCKGVKILLESRIYLFDLCR